MDKAGWKIVAVCEVGIELSASGIEETNARERTDRRRGDASVEKERVDLNPGLSQSVGIEQ